MDDTNESGGAECVPSQLDVKNMITDMCKCCVCFEVSVEPYVCGNSHVVCFGCASKIDFESAGEQKCPTCRESFVFREDRNLKILNTVINDKMITCPYRGCFVSYRPLTDNHHMHCSRRPFYCIHCRVYNRRQKWTSISRIESHYEQTHSSKRVYSIETGVVTDVSLKPLIDATHSSRDVLLGSTMILRVLAPIMHSEELLNVSIGGIIVSEACKSGSKMFSFFVFGNTIPIFLRVYVRLDRKLYATYMIEPLSVRNENDPHDMLKNSVRFPQHLYRQMASDSGSSIGMRFEVCATTVGDQKVRPLLCDWSRRPNPFNGDAVYYVTTDIRVINGVVIKDGDEDCSISLEGVGEVSVERAYYNLFTREEAHI
jgi:hypothetical protein